MKLMSKIQLDFELKSHHDANEKLKRQVREAKEKAYFSSTIQARMTTNQLLLPTADILTDYFTQASQGRAVASCSVRVSEEMLRLFIDVAPEKVAAILLKSVLDLHGVFNKKTLPAAARFIGTRIEDEARFTYYSTISPPDVVRAMNERVKASGSSPHYRRLSTKLITEHKLVQQHNFADDKLWNDWSDELRLMMGLSLIEVAKKIGLVERTISWEKGMKSRSYLELSKEAIALHEESFNRILADCYLSYPLLVQPVEWTKQDGLAAHNTTGGYYTDFIRAQNPMCRGGHYRSEFDDMSIRFLNTISKTAWTIDHEILEVQRLLQEKETSVGSFLTLHRDPRLDEGMPLYLVERPKDDEERREWRHQQKTLHERFEEQRRKSIRSRQSVSMANMFLKHCRFYLSWSNDYRGRVYSQQAWLSPQSTDAEKALIRFADGCKLDERGEWWAAQAVGAAYLGSRLNLDERVKWTYDNAQLIVDVATEPYQNRHLWEKAKSPFEFLQLAIEWYKVVITKQEHIWRIGVGADATASGLQLLSSMLRDENGMKFSNVLAPETPSSPPQDAYLEVLRVAREIAASDAKTEHLVPHLIHRGLGKTMMVQVYGASWLTIRDRVIKVLDEEKLYPDVLTKDDAGLITTLVKQASRKVFPSAFQALDWLAKIAKVAVKNGSTEFCWTTPAGDTIRLREFEAASKDITTSHLGKVRIPIGSSGPDTKAIKSALPPSFIHSYDAALLKVAFQEWKKPIAVIHDCLKVLPTDMDRALERVRRAFYQICDNNPLAELADSLGVSQDDVKRLEQGEGCLGDVMNSTYLFN